METHTRIKICGITNPEDARAVVDYGADALGFIFVPESPRCVSLHQGSGWMPMTVAIPPFVTKVYVSRRLTDMRLHWASYFDVVQFYEDDSEHGAPPPQEHAYVQAFRLRDESSLEELDRHAAGVSALLLDAYHANQLGGAGVTFDWNLACEAKARTNLPIILAGGLTPENVAQAIQTVRPYAVDVSSGVESEPGRKDHAKLRAFIRAVRSCDY